jgi:hypothetical protein
MLDTQRRPWQGTGRRRIVITVEAIHLVVYPQLADNPTVSNSW